jgi:hypothetical protein
MGTGLRGETNGFDGGNGPLVSNGPPGCGLGARRVRCQGCLMPRVLDVIPSLGERLSVSPVAVALKQQGIASEAIEATELVVTDFEPMCC